MKLNTSIPVKDNHTLVDEMAKAIKLSISELIKEGNNSGGLSNIINAQLVVLIELMVFGGLKKEVMLNLVVEFIDENYDYFFERIKKVVEEVKE